MVNKLDLKTFTSEFDSHSYGLVPHLNNKLCKLLLASVSSADSSTKMSAHRQV